MYWHWLCIELDGHINDCGNEGTAEIVVFYLPTETYEHRFWEHASVLVSDCQPTLYCSCVIEQFKS